MSSRKSVTPTAEEQTARAMAGVHRPQQQTLPDADAAWAFYASGLVDEGDDDDTEDELETADFIRFQRARAHSRLRASSQRERQLQQCAASAPNANTTSGTP